MTPQYASTPQFLYPGTKYPGSTWFHIPEESNLHFHTVKPSNLTSSLPSSGVCCCVVWYIFTITVFIIMVEESHPAWRWRQFFSKHWLMSTDYAESLPRRYYFRSFWMFFNLHAWYACRISGLYLSQEFASNCHNLYHPADIWSIRNPAP
jgi:hypothetical protein